MAANISILVLFVLSLVLNFDSKIALVASPSFFRRPENWVNDLQHHLQKSRLGIGPTQNILILESQEFAMEEEISVNEPKNNRSPTHLNPVSYELFILVLTIFSLLVVAGLLVPPSKPAADAILLRVDFIICAVFFFDFLLNLWRAPNRADYFFRRGGWLDLLGTIPAVPGLHWTALFRLARLNRLVRIVKHLQGKDREEVFAEARETPARTILLTTIFLAILLMTIASLFILRFERGTPGANITTGAIAFWWAFVTMTTVGYGDYVPITFLGRILAMALMTFGIGIFAVLTSFVASRLVIRQDDQEYIVAIVKEENAIIRSELAELIELLKQQGALDDQER
jgi:voltage-gated potassium channel